MAQIPVFKGGVKVFEIEVDDDMYEELSKSVWYACSGTKQYAQRKVKAPNGIFWNQKLHQTILGLPRKSGVVVDHIDRNPLNCRKSNLRMVTFQENSWNRSKRKRETTSRYTGVSWATHQRWVATIDGEHIGYFDSEENAAKAYDYEARQRRGAFAVVNFPDVNEKPAPDRKTLTKRKYVTVVSKNGKPKYHIQITCCEPRIITTRTTLEAAIECRNEKLKELGVPIPD